MGCAQGGRIPPPKHHESSKHRSVITKNGDKQEICRLALGGVLGVCSPILPSTIIRPSAVGNNHCIFCEQYF